MRKIKGNKVQKDILQLGGGKRKGMMEELFRGEMEEDKEDTGKS